MKYFSYSSFRASFKVLKGKYLALLPCMMLAIGYLYFYLLYSAATGIIYFGNYYVYFDLASSVLVALILSLVITMNIYSYTRSSRVSNKPAIAAIISAIVPSGLCCTSIIPSVLALAGASTTFIIGNTGKVQAIFSYYAPFFIAAGIIIAFLGLVQVTNNIAQACKLEQKDNCCEARQDES